jgi:hypothetical protein
MTNRPKPQLPRWKPPPWTERADALVRIAHPKIAATKLGITINEVLARRDELGLPPVNEQFPKRGEGKRQEDE